MVDLPRPLEEIIHKTTDSVVDTIDYLIHAYAYESGLGVLEPAGKLPSNKTREIDRESQHLLEHAIRRHIFGAANIEIAGEEAKKENRFASEKGIIASIDAVDGTDLYAKGFANWCSALFYYVPNSFADSRVIASFVGAPVEAIFHSQERQAPSGIVYYASQSEDEAYKIGVFEGKPTDRTIIRIPATEKAVSLKDAAVCFYGQKATSMLTYSKNRSFVNILEKLSKMAKDADQNKKTIEKLQKEDRPAEAEKLRKETINVDFRLYNLAGNPMMVRLAEGRVHAVVDINGQDLYDVVPGAYIAQKAGAHWGDLDGNEITADFLRENYLSRLAHEPMKYILATSKDLYDELRECLR